ncbi:Malate:quinone oxidoreductase [Candidatus Johnevansia muelleri]|uniref:Probable malate:quinone oxidoreductase n=1 Tax=Candidatus Johnevansia muelleri TaxID=1495769 RepID=A0A078KBG4_9GAMM|nr:Malate:quinone oxidoreductase [Candidatus Evansia muelleri]
MNEFYEQNIVLIGAGIMSATLAILLKLFDPTLKIEIIESLDFAAAESSNALNNAGTGHAALCELNYTPQCKNGSINIEKAININTMFEVSKQFWSYLIQDGKLNCKFINKIQHISFCNGIADTNYLEHRYISLKNHHCFSDIEFTRNKKTITDWAPLIMDGRNINELVAATRFQQGTDIDYGELTQQLLKTFKQYSNSNIFYNQNVIEIKKEINGYWRLIVECKKFEYNRNIIASLVFIGAGGGSLPLLQKSGIPEGKLFAGFPISGQWLKCDDKELVKRHKAKVYSKASVNAPPMSMPHLDTRIVNGKSSLIFGPFAGFSTKFLKNGSLLDLPRSLRFSTILPILYVAINNIDLIKYLIKQLIQTNNQRIKVLRKFYPNAIKEDWRLEVAGQRVQIIKKDYNQGGILLFGTELVLAKDRSLAALLGASPGASISVSIMLQLIEHCFKEKFNTFEWKNRLKEIIPFNAYNLANNKNSMKIIRKKNNEILNIL